MLNENIKNLRKSKGLSQEEFVRLAPFLFMMSAIGIALTYKKR